MNIREHKYLEARAFSEFITELSLTIVNRKASIGNTGDEIALNFYEKVYDSCVWSWNVAYAEQCGDDPVAYKVMWDEVCEQQTLMVRFIVRRSLKSHKVSLHRDMLQATHEVMMRTAQEAHFRGCTTISSRLMPV